MSELVVICPGPDFGWPEPVTLGDALGPDSVAAFRVGGIPEVVRENETGFLEKFGDINALARALDRLADEPALAQKMGAAGQRDAAERFSAEIIVPRYEAVYDRVMSARQTSGGVSAIF